MRNEPDQCYGLEKGDLSYTRCAIFFYYLKQENREMLINEALENARQNPVRIY